LLLMVAFWPRRDSAPPSRASSPAQVLLSWWWWHFECAGQTPRAAACYGPKSLMTWPA
jgi:hypothetical protein